MILHNSSRSQRLLVLACLLCTGCEERITGLGGGADSTVNVTILPQSSGGVADGNGGAAAVAGYGTLTGRITFAGNVPSLVSPAAGKVKSSDEAVCVLEKIPNEALVTQDGGLGNVFIYLQKAPAGTRQPEAAEAVEIVMDHNSCVFIPHALVVRAGQPIRVLNDDALPHNVHTYPVRNGVFNSGIGADDRTGIELKYKNGERLPVKVGCDFHTWMLAYHLPLDHPYGAVTSPTGEFTIPDLPAGKHKFTIAHEGKIIVAEQEVTIEPDGTAQLELSLSSDQLQLAP